MLDVPCVLRSHRYFLWQCLHATIGSGSSDKMLKSNQIGEVFLVPLAFCFLYFLSAGMRGIATPMSAGCVGRIREIGRYVTKK